MIAAQFTKVAREKKGNIKRGSEEVFWVLGERMKRGKQKNKKNGTQIEQIPADFKIRFYPPNLLHPCSINPEN